MGRPRQRESPGARCALKPYEEIATVASSDSSQWNIGLRDAPEEHADPPCLSPEALDSSSSPETARPPYAGTTFMA